MSTTSYPVVNTLTGDEIAATTAYLISTRDKLLEIVNGLSDSQWNFKPAAENWSIAGIVEHLAIIEERVQARINQMPDSPVAEADRDNLRIDRVILSEVPRRSNKVQAPPPICPTGRWTPDESLKHFKQRRGHTLQLLAEAPCLRGRLQPHPVLGGLDGYEWILAAAAHTARHIDQILEIKACADFPTSVAAG